MLILVFCTALYITGIVLSARALSRNEIRKFWRVNCVIALLGLLAAYVTMPIYKSYDSLALVLTQVSALAAYPIIIASVALVVGIRKKFEVTIAWGAVFLLLGIFLFAVVVGSM